jgi:ABC-type glycerol-3-phosphate transport system substrate-binding protein
MFGETPWDAQNFQASRFDQPAVIEAIQKFADFYVKYGTTPVQDPLSGINVTGSDVEFMNGNMAMMMGGTWNTQTYLDPVAGIKTFGFDNAYIPINPATGVRRMVGQPNVFVMFRKTSSPDAAWALLKEMCISEYAQNVIAPAVEIPALKSAAKNVYQGQWLNQLGHPNVQLDMMSNYTDSAQYGLLDQSQWFVTVDNMLDAVWKGADVEATCTQIAKTMNSMLQQEKDSISNGK